MRFRLFFGGGFRLYGKEVAIIHIYELAEGYGKICHYFRYITQEETEAYNETIELMNATHDDHDEELELVYRETEKQKV